ncbi:transcription factor bHLH75-like [Senna tora]|uniref:Transcription factor bHLH75-like n=1 Tax=Senna tora TaxID=362788 RepID=A0A834TST7_9FABA|nr:transcription factor bHLH75-like [Senna tora]
MENHPSSSTNTQKLITSFSNHTFLDPNLNNLSSQTLLEFSPTPSAQKNKVRREKINEKLRCLQDLVPGCYKAMGMAVMLDVIIDYVQSLQHQIELTTASMHFDFNTLEMDYATQTSQSNIGTCEVQEMEKKIGEEGFGGYSYNFNPTWKLR